MSEEINKVHHEFEVHYGRGGSEVRQRAFSLDFARELVQMCADEHKPATIFRREVRTKVTVSDWESVE